MEDFRQNRARSDEAAPASASPPQLAHLGSHLSFNATKLREGILLGTTYGQAPKIDNRGNFTLRQGRTEEEDNKPRPPGNTRKRETEGESGSHERPHEGHIGGLMKSKGRHVKAHCGGKHVGRDPDFERQG